MVTDIRWFIPYFERKSSNEIAIETKVVTLYLAKNGWAKQSKKREAKLRVKHKKFEIILFRFLNTLNLTFVSR